MTGDNSIAATPLVYKYIEHTLSSIFRDQLHIELPSAEAELLQSGLLDSVKLVDLLLELEQRFGIKIALEDLELDDFRTVGQIATLVQRALAESKQ